MKTLDLLSELRTKGYRITSARKIILETVQGSDKPFSALDLHLILRKKGLATSQVTVYRELAFLEEQGIVQGGTFQDGTKRYCLSSIGHHHHLICMECRDVQDVTMENDLHAVEQKIRKEKKFIVQSHALEFYGLCKKCT